MSTGDVKTLPASFIPEAQAKAIQEFAGISESEAAVKLQNEIKELKVLCLDRLKNLSETEATLVLYSVERDDGNIRSRDESVVKFVTSGAEWKTTGS